MSLESVFKLSLIMNMVDHLTGPMARVQSSVGGSVSKLQSMEQTFGDMTKTGAAMAGIGAQIASTALAPVQATFATKKALGELKSVGIKDLKALEKASEDFSNTWAGTSKAEFIGAAYDIKSGIASLSDEAVAKYTEMAGITAKGTKATIGEMTSLFATGYGIYKDFYKDMSDIDFGEMFAAGIGHAANIFKTDGPQMAQAISTLGAAATSAKVPMEEQFAILGMLQATMSGSEAGTKYRAFLQAAARAGEELGLKFTDANNQLLSLPEILGKLRDKFGETMDAAEKMQLQKAFGTDEAVAMIDLLYSKTGDLQSNILSMYDSMGKGVSEVREMANAINDTEPDKYQVLQQRLHNVAETIGNSLLPTVNELLGKGEEVLTKVGSWIENNQELVRVIMIIVLALGGFLAVAGTTIAVVGGVGLVFTKTAGLITGFYRTVKGIPDLLETIQIRALYAGDSLKRGFSAVKTFASSAVTGIKNVAVNIASMARTAAINGVTALKNMALGLVGMARQAITTAVTAMPGLIASVWSFTAALLANPITWIIVGIVALVAAIILLWRNWDSVVSWIQGVWNGFVNGIKAGFDWIRNLFSGMPAWLQIAIAAFMPFIGIPMLIITHWDAIVGFFTNLWSRVKDAFVNGINAVKNFFLGIPEWFRQSGAKIIDTLVEGIKSAAMKPVEAVKGIFQKVRNLLPFSDANGIKAGFDWIRNLFSGMPAWLQIAIAAFMPFIGIPMLIITHWDAIVGFFTNLWSRVKDAFVNGINAVKNFFLGIPEWFRQSGAKIIDTLVEGIKSAAMKPVEAVKGIFQKVRNLLPFSDAKEGPLSELTLSGHRTMSTLAQGIEQGADLPAQAVEKGLSRIDTTGGREPVKKVNLKEISREKETSETTTERDKGVNIDKLLLNVDLSKIKELPLLLKLLKEIEDYVNSNGLVTEGEG